MVNIVGAEIWYFFEHLFKSSHRFVNTHMKTHTSLESPTAPTHKSSTFNQRCQLREEMLCSKGGSLRYMLITRQAKDRLRYVSLSGLGFFFFFESTETGTAIHGGLGKHDGKWSCQEIECLSGPQSNGRSKKRNQIHLQSRTRH